MKSIRFELCSLRLATFAVFALALAVPLFAQASSPWENAVGVLQQAFTSTIARGLSLVAIVVSGLTFAFGEGGSKRVLAGVLFGVGMAIAAVKFFSLSRQLKSHNSFLWRQLTASGPSPNFFFLSPRCPHRLHRSSLRLKAESELLTGATDAIVETEEFHTGDGGTNGQCGCQVNRV
jgi:type IV secretory pathway VirB2 component (pilin)